MDKKLLKELKAVVLDRQLQQEVVGGTYYCGWSNAYQQVCPSGNCSLCIYGGHHCICCSGYWIVC